MPTTAASQGEQQRLAKAMSHPHRAAALTIFSERAASTNEVANELDLDVRHLGYHVRKLRDLECIEEVGTKRNRGAIETFYRATVKPMVSDDEWPAVPRERRPGLIGQFFRAILNEGLRSVKAGVLGNDSKFWIGPDPHKVDEQGLDEILALHNELHERSLEVVSAYGERRARGEAGEPVDVISAHACFRGAPPS